MLTGCRVLDLTDEKGSLCGRILGDFGADVVRIEPPGGHPARKTPPYFKDIPGDDSSLPWLYTNANKRGITLNLAVAEGLEIFVRLVQSADVAVESFEPGYLQSLGIGYAELSRTNPKLVLASVSPFGQDGPYAHFKAADIVMAAMGGMARIYGDLGGTPTRISEPQAFFLGSLHAAVGSVIAYYHAQTTGEGQHVDVSTQDAVVLSLMTACEMWDLLKVTYKSSGPYVLTPRPAPAKPLLQRRVFRCRDGHVLFYWGSGGAAGTVASTRELVKAANEGGALLELTAFPWASFDVATTTQEEVDRLQGLIAGYLITKTKAELLDMALKRSIQVAPVLTVEDAAQSPQLAARGWFTSVEHPDLGATIPYPGRPLNISSFPWAIRRRAPLIGEHNQEIYEGELGLSQEKVAALRSKGVI